MMRSPNRPLITALPCSHRYHDEENDDPEDDEHADLTPRFLRPTTLGQALDLTDQCVFITEPAYPYPVVHANSAFTRLSEYNFHEIARRPCLFLQVCVREIHFIFLLKGDTCPYIRSRAW